jgi:hypothetical protein
MKSQGLQSVTSAIDVTASVRILLRELIDFAGLFPPASLTMAQSLADYDSYLRWEFGWILGRLIVPLSRLTEFEAAFARLPALAGDDGASCWRLSVILGADANADIARIREFNGRMDRLTSGTPSSSRKAVVDSVEVRVTGAEEVRRLSEIIPQEFSAYFEIPIVNCGENIAAVASCRRRAKIRTGGETEDNFPSAANVVEFIRLCAKLDVPFKATAGLHHPLRSVHKLTYQSDSPSGMMHGFINIFLAAAFVKAGIEEELAVRLLQEQSPEAFRFDSTGVEWRGHRLRADQLADTRQQFSVSFGSCSFTEPIDDLRLLRLL